MRKNLLEDLVGGKGELTPVNSENPAPKKAAPLGSKGAVGAMSRALSQITSERDAEAKGGLGLKIVEVDPALIDRSIVRDRMQGATADHAALVASIRSQGQQVPVLLRPHVTEPGRYQIAYGHRRVDAVREIGIAARAIIRQLSDGELVVAQGTENSARKDLSFIERAAFGAVLEDRGFGRDTIMAALSVDKTELSRLISVARSVPAEVIHAIGPAPKAGRRRWMDLADRLSHGSGETTFSSITESEDFRAVEDSNKRFAFFFEAVAPKLGKIKKPEIWIDPKGRRLARVERAEDRFVLSIDEKLEPQFGDYLLERLPEILTAFQCREEA